MHLNIRDGHKFGHCPPTKKPSDIQSALQESTRSLASIAKRLLGGHSAPDPPDPPVAALHDAQDDLSDEEGVDDENWIAALIDVDKKIRAQERHRVRDAVRSVSVYSSASRFSPQGSTINIRMP